MSELEDDTGERSGPGSGAGLRIDKWLWCARFYRTRSLAQQAVEGGHVQVNGDRVKASRSVRIGDRVRVIRERDRMEVDVVGIPARRGPATEAQRHYSETSESRAAREHQRELARLAAAPDFAGRPDKRERRQLLRVKGRGSD